jgi:hypothetical protein
MKGLIRPAICVVSLVMILACDGLSGPLKPREISADARWAAHIDVEKVVASRIGGHFRETLEKEGEMAKIEAVGTLFDFHPLVDLYSVTVWGTSFTAEEGVALVKGRFDRKKILALMVTHGEKKETEFRGHTIYEWTDGGEHFFVCFSAEETVLFSNSRKLTQDALDVLSGEKESLEAGGKLKGLKSLPAGTFFAAAARGFEEIAEKDPEAAILLKAEGVVVAAGELEGIVFVDAVITAQDEKTAGQVHGILNGFIALGQLISGQHPEIVDLVQSARLNLSGRQITFRESMSADKLFKLMSENID